MKQSNNSRISLSYLFIITLFCDMMFTSCINDLPYDASICAPKLVLNALLMPDSLLTATVSRTVHFLDTEKPQRLSDAQVTATINGEELILSYDEPTQTYLSHYRLNAGDEITLTATHTLGTASATAKVIPPTPIGIAHTTIQPFTNPGDPVSLAILNDVDSALLVGLHIEDPADETNYYRLTVGYYGSYLVRYPEGTYNKPKQADTGDNTVEYLATEEIFYPHYLFSESSSRLMIDSESGSQLLESLLYMTYNNSIIFTDEQLRNAEGEPIIEFLMLMESPRTNDNMYNPESGWVDYNGRAVDFIYPSDTVSHATYHYHFTVEQLSEDYYHYLNTGTAYEMSMGVFVGEGVPIHSNIHGGLGIVGSYSTTECSGYRGYLLP